MTRISTLRTSAGASGRTGGSMLAAFLGRATLRAGNYPGRQMVGTLLRRKARQQGGRSFTVESHDGTRLAAWYFRAHERRQTEPSRAGEAAPARPLPGVIVSHGWCEVKEFHFARARRLNALGHDVVLFDHRGHGRSGGRHVTFGVHERRDVAAVADAAIERGLPGFVDERFVTLGFSLGAATVLQHAAIDPRVERVVAIAPFVDFREAILSFRACWAPWMNAAWLMRGFERATRAHGFELDEATTLEAMRRVRVPVLLIEGGRDRNLPPGNHTQKLIPAKTAGDLRVIRVPPASHRSLCHQCWPEVEQELERFCRGEG